VLQFGSSSQAVFFKMRVAGVLHIFQFETRQGEDICMALQTHINDIMMKRYSKVGQLQLQPPASLMAQSITHSACRLWCGVVRSISPGWVAAHCAHHHILQHIPTIQFPLLQWDAGPMALMLWREQVI
jgi:hypothetical protein